MGSRVHVRCALRFHGRDGDEAPSPVEVVLDGAWDEEALDPVDYSIGSGQCVRAEDHGAVDRPLLSFGGVVGLEGEVVVRGECIVSGRPGLGLGSGDSGGDDVGHEEGLKGP